jgi:hypothetical protein
VFHEIIEGAKKQRFKGERTDEINATNRKKSTFGMFNGILNENYELITHYSLDKLFI